MCANISTIIFTMSEIMITYCYTQYIINICKNINNILIIKIKLFFVFLWILETYTQKIALYNQYFYNFGFKY